MTVDVRCGIWRDNTSTTNFLALTVIYVPAQIAYTVEYYQQSVGGTEGYIMVGKNQRPEHHYGSKISREDGPDFEPG